MMGKEGNNLHFKNQKPKIDFTIKHLDCNQSMK